eukprot:scaffold59816_cov57-Phaeocystis_antarctica.AAC.3
MATVTAIFWTMADWACSRTIALCTMNSTRASSSGVMASMETGGVPPAGRCSFGFGGVIAKSRAAWRVYFSFKPEFNRQPQPCRSPLETCGRPPGSSEPPGADGLLMPPSSLCLLYARHIRRSRPVCAGADESGDRFIYPIWSGGASSNLSQGPLAVLARGSGMPSEIATSIASSPVIC